MSTNIDLASGAVSDLAKGVVALLELIKDNASAEALATANAALAQAKSDLDAAKASLATVTADRDTAQADHAALDQKVGELAAYIPQISKLVADKIAALTAPAASTGTPSAPESVQSAAGQPL